MRESQGRCYSCLVSRFEKYENERRSNGDAKYFEANNVFVSRKYTSDVYLSVKGIHSEERFSERCKPEGLYFVNNSWIGLENFLSHKVDVYKLAAQKSRSWGKVDPCGALPYRSPVRSAFRREHLDSASVWTSSGSVKSKGHISRVGNPVKNNDSLGLAKRALPPISLPLPSAFSIPLSFPIFLPRRTPDWLSPQ